VHGRMVDGLKGFGREQTYFARSVGYHRSYDYGNYVAALYVACFVDGDENLPAVPFSYSLNDVVIALRCRSAFLNFFTLEEPLK
jgi:hypothetical protein